jgi:F-type H+-transporting ATPase subunit delta
VAPTDDLVRGYAQAMFAVAQAEDELEQVEGQLYAFASLLEREDRVRDALNDPALPVENKRGLIRDTLGERANPIALNLLAFLVEQGRARDIDRVIASMSEVAADSRRHALAEVRSAVPLDDRQRERLARALSDATGHEVEVRVTVDPSLLGGIVARVGDTIFDGSVRSRLDEAKQQMAGA